MLDKNLFNGKVTTEDLKDFMSHSYNCNSAPIDKYDYPVSYIDEEEEKYIVNKLRYELTIAHNDYDIKPPTALYLLEYIDKQISILKDARNRIFELDKIRRINDGQ